jgi:hypothetical protein
MLIIGTDTTSKVWMAGNTEVPALWNGITLIGHTLTPAQEAAYNALPADRLGTMFDGINFSVPALSLADARTKQIALLTTSYNAAIQFPVSYMATSFQADADSQSVVVKSLSPGAVPAGFAWLDINNVSVPMTFVQLQGLAAAMLARGWAAFQNLQTRKTAVRDATTVAQVQAIIW